MGTLWPARDRSFVRVLGWSTPRCSRELPWNGTMDFLEYRTYFVMGFDVSFRLEIPNEISAQDILLTTKSRCTVGHLLTSWVTLL